MNSDIPIFIINLKKDTAKKQHMEALCQQHGLSYQFTEAVYGEELKKEKLSEVYDKEESIRIIGRELTKGEIGCALSHINIYKHIVKKNIPQAIIFEDDIHIEDDFHSIIAAIDKFPTDWELILFGYYQKEKKDDLVTFSLRGRKKISSSHNLVRLLKPREGAHGYMINIHGAKKLLPQLTNLHKPLDLYTGNDKHINVYAIYPCIIQLHHIFSKQSNLETARIAIKKDYPTFYNTNKTISYKIKQELLRPLKQFLNYTKRFKKPKKYT